MKNIRIVLVQSKYPRNVGMAARTMANFGLKDLILVSPRCTIDFEAHQGAAGGQGPLRSAKIYETWEDFFATEPDAQRIAFSRRQGRRRASLNLKETFALDVIDMTKPLYLIFGAEDHGLSADDLEHVHRVVHFDLPGELQSVNLSHSVLMAIHSFYFQFGKNEPQKQETTAPYKDPSPFLKLWLESLNFDLESQTRWNALTMLKQLIMRSTPTPEEINKLEMIVQQTVRRIKQGS